MNDQQDHDPRQQKSRGLFEAIDKGWQDLVTEHGVTGTEPPRTQITEAQLGALMLEAAEIQTRELYAEDPAAIPDHGLPMPKVADLLASVREMQGQLASEIDARASGSLAERDLEVLGSLHTLVAQLVKHVTRFLEHPGTRLSHADHEGDLAVARADVLSTGEVMVTCGEIDGDGTPLFLPLSQLWPAGPVSDAARVIVQTYARELIKGIVANLISTGQLKVPDLPGGKAVIDEALFEAGVDQLQAAPSYVIGEGGQCKAEGETDG